MRKWNIVVVGYGVVGQLEYKNMLKLQPDIYDKYKPEVCTYNADIVYDLAFIAVPTNKTEKSLCDITEVRAALDFIKANIYVIKSTVLPGTSKRLAEETGKRIVFSPEHSGATQHCNNFEYDFTILGGNKEDCCQVIQALQQVYDGRHKFRVTDHTTAEISKYMLNCFLATKVSFCNSFFELCKQLGCSYEELRELFVLDSRISPAHTFSYEDAPYWDSHCFNKDVPALADTFDIGLLQAVNEFNNYQKKKYGFNKYNA